MPVPPGPPPYRRALSDVLGGERLGAIEAGGALRFHAVGDTGGWRDPGPQLQVAAAMVGDLHGPAPVNFFYHLGDVVYPHGEEANYGPQFFAPYAGYNAPIFAVPGNHDGEVVRGSRARSLEPFMKTFCSASAPLHDAAVDARRPPAGQPNVYWTLVHDWVRIIGLYTNVHEDGEIAEDQLDWLIGELRDAPSGVTLILAVHRPVFSVDTVHGSNLDLREALDACFATAGREPDALFSGHVHNYQRFARRHRGRQVPYVVAGAGGYHEPHALGSGLPALPARFPGLDGVSLRACQSNGHGFMTVTADPAGASVVYRSVSARGVRTVDRFAIVPAR